MPSYQLLHGTHQHAASGTDPSYYNGKSSVTRQVGDIFWSKTILEDVFPEYSNSPTPADGDHHTKFRRQAVSTYQAGVDDDGLSTMDYLELQEFAADHDIDLGELGWGDEAAMIAAIVAAVDA